LLATFAIMRHETRSWKWTLFMIGYLNVLAYLGFVYHVPRWLVVRVVLMNWQTITALALVVWALIYVIWKFFRQFYTVEKDPHCEYCPVPKQAGHKKKTKDVWLH